MKRKECNAQDAKIMLMFMQNQDLNVRNTKFVGVCSTQTYSLKKRILKCCSKGERAVNKEMSQLHNREVFKHVMLSEPT